MEIMGEDIHTVCDDHSSELEMFVSIITKQGQCDLGEDVLYITEADLPEYYYEAQAVFTFFICERSLFGLWHCLNHRLQVEFAEQFLHTV